jgi:predicted alpha/beta superfamily hydrolase
MKQVWIIITFLSSTINVFSQNQFFDIDTIQVNSLILNEKRSVIIYKPINIVKSDSVKFLYLLEGEYSNNICQEVHKRFKDSISNLIIIGIINPERKRDMLYVHAADKFLDFITLELIPFVEKDFKTSMRILNGHSFCGSFTIYTLIHKPNHFNCFIASSPTPIMAFINKDDYQKIDSVAKNRIVLYFSFGSKDMGQVRKWSLRLKDTLTGMKLKNLDWRFEIFEGKNHFNSDIIALLNGLIDLKK